MNSESSAEHTSVGVVSPTPSSSPLQITRMDRELYIAAMKGDFEKFQDQNIETLLTPNKNTVLHLHMTCRIDGTVDGDKGMFIIELARKIAKEFPDTVSQQFVEKILDKCSGLILLANSKGETLLHVAAGYGHYDVSELLIDRAKDIPDDDIENGVGTQKKLIRATNCEKDSALHEAVRYNHIEIAKILLETDPYHSYCSNNAGETPLYLASYRKDKQMVKMILAISKSPPAYSGPNGQTALHAAVINRDIEMTRDLLANQHLRGAVKHADKKGWVPLHYAAKIGDKKLICALLEEDENTAYMQDIEGRTALHIAANCGHDSIVLMIMIWYPDCSEIVDKKGRNALHYAVLGESSSVIDVFMHHQQFMKHFNEKDSDGNTALHLLANSLILNRGLVYHPRVDKLAKNNKYQTPLDVVYATCEDSERPFEKSLIRALKYAGALQSPQENINWEKSTKRIKAERLAFTKEAKESHLLVATLIATVSFAAGFTLPGGTIQDGEHKGTPILGQKASFKAFIVTNTLALVFAASAAFIHLFAPLNKARKDYYLSELALSFTLIAIATMIISFATGTYAVLGCSSFGITVLIIGLSFFLVFRKVIKMNFTGISLCTFMKKLANVIIFPFNKFTPTGSEQHAAVTSSFHPEEIQQVSKKSSTSQFQQTLPNRLGNRSSTQSDSTQKHSMDHKN